MHCFRGTQFAFPAANRKTIHGSQSILENGSRRRRPDGDMRTFNPGDLAARRRTHIALRSGSSFFNGWRSTPGTTPLTSQLALLISTTTTKVESGSNAVRLRLRSLTWATGQPPSVRMDDEGATTSAARPIASLTSGVSDGEALIGPGMTDTRRGKPAVGQFRHPIPREAVLLAAPPKRSTPEVGNVMPER